MFISSAVTFGVRGHVRALALVTRPYVSGESGDASPHSEKSALLSNFLTVENG